MAYQGGVGGDYNQYTLDDLVTLLGNGYLPGYESNQSGSAEAGYNQILNQFTPEQLIRRYETLKSPVGTPLDQLQKQAFETMRSALGRSPTSQEFASLLPAFQGPNGLTNGRAAVANLQQQYRFNPSLDPGNQAYNQKPEDISAGVTQQFQSILGRDPTADELSHFSQAVQSNQVDIYGLGNFLKQMPEYTNAQDKTFREGLAGELENYDVSEFNRQKGDIYADYARRGINIGSSPSLDYALTDLMGKIAQNRQAYLANLSAQQYGGNKDLAIGNYQNSLNDLYANNQAQRQRQQGLSDYFLNRGNEGADYFTQMGDYQRMLSGQRQGRNTLHTPDWIGLGLAGANTAANFAYLL